MICVYFNIIGTFNNRHSIRLNSPLGKKSLQGPTLKTIFLDFVAYSNAIKVWVDLESKSIKIDRLPMGP